MLGALSLLIGTASLAGVERIIFSPRLTRDRILASKKTLADGSTRTRSLLQRRLAAGQTNGAFILIDRCAGTPDASEGDAPTNRNYIRYAGSMRMPDGTLRALLDSGSAAVGDTVRGCVIQQIEEKQIVIRVDDQDITVTQNEKYYYTPAACQPLRLDRIGKHKGSWVAFFHGTPCRAGDWVDAQTQVLAVTPSLALVERNQIRQTFSTDNPTGEYRAPKN
jgi:hypothetical protein